MKVYDAENNEVPALSGFLAESLQNGKDALSIGQAENGEIAELLPKNVIKPVHMQAADLSNPRQDSFGFAFSVDGTEEGSYAWTSLQKNTGKIIDDGLEPDAVTFDQPEYWYIETVVACSVGTMESYTDTGDVNLDGKSTVADAVLLARVVAEDETVNVSELGLALGDVDEDGELSAFDVAGELHLLAFGTVEDTSSLGLLTVEKLKTLMKKGDALSWKDFARYNHETVQNDAFATSWRLYMDNSCELRISGSDTDTKPDQILLFMNRGHYDVGDIREITLPEELMNKQDLTWEALHELLLTKGREVTWADFKKYNYIGTLGIGSDSLNIKLENGWEFRLAGFESTAWNDITLWAPDGTRYDLAGLTADDIPWEAGMPQKLSYDTVRAMLRNQTVSWSDFAPYPHQDLSAKSYIWEFELESGQKLTLYGDDLEGVPDKMLVTYPTGVEMDIREVND